MRSPSITRLVLACSFASIAMGCPRTQPPPPPPVDGGPGVPDAMVIDYTDTDADGVCDRTEAQRGTDPSLTDTDGDGLSDRAELDFGYLPNRTDSPDRDTLVVLYETPSFTASFPIVYVTPRSTAGASFIGGFAAIDVVDPLDVRASSFFVDASAIGADPMENVFEVRATEQRFVGVVGRTQLVFEARFAFGANEPRGCTRAYPWRYNVKRDDGTIVFAPRYLVVVVPEGERIDTAAWCVPEGRCI